MRFSHFRYGYRDGREFNVSLFGWQLRVARYQVALWRGYKPLFMWLAK